MALIEMRENPSYDTYVEKVMYERKKETLNKLFSIIHPNYLEAFSKFLAFSWHESSQEALDIAEKLNLCEEDFFAVEENFKMFRKSLEEKYMEEAVNDYD